MRPSRARRLLRSLGQVNARWWTFLRRAAWPLFNIYGISVVVGGFTLLVALTLLYPPEIDGWLFVFLILLSVATRLLGLPIGDLTHSLFGIVDLTALLIMGPLVGAWQSALAILITAVVNVLRGITRTTWTSIKLPLFNAALKAIMAPGAGSLYLALGGRLRPSSLDANLIIPGLALILVWFTGDYVAWSLLGLFTGGRTRFIQWTRYTVVSSMLVELLPLPFAFLNAAITVTLGGHGLLMFSLALVLACLMVNLVAQARRRLEQRVTELATLNRVSEEIIRASRSEQDICEIIYRQAKDVVDTTYFLLGLIEEDKQTETLCVLVADGERHPSQTMPVGGVVSWMQQHRRPLLVSDLHQERLPFAPRHVGSNAGRVRSALFVPMLAGQDLIGFMSIQSLLPNSFTADETRILAAMANQAAMAIANIRLQRQAEAQARLEREVRLASDIQRSLLPASFPVMPGFEIAAHWRSAREVSGDFYDFLQLPHDRLGIVIADVSDKGVPAALFMALSRSLVRAALLGAVSPAEGLRRANRWIMKDTASDMFLTLFYAVLDPVNHTLTYVNAGHNPPLLLHHERRDCRYLDEHGIALGVMENAEYTEHAVSLIAGDVIICYTDGITDALNAQGVPFGEERLRLVANQYCTLPPAQIIEKINAALADHVGDEPAFDDATLIVARCV